MSRAIHSEATADEYQDPPDRKLRSYLFWTVLSVFVVVVSSSHLLQKLCSYPLAAKDPGTGRWIPKPLHHGSYGFYLGKVPRRNPNDSMVVLFGNSVHQHYGIVPKLQARADKDGRHVAFINLAMAGSGIHDHLVELAKIVKRKPDLVVISFINLAFTTDFGRKDALPRFRTDADQMAFDPEVVRVMPRSFYRREFTLDSACHSIVSTLVPFRRLDPILRCKLKQGIEKKIGIPSWFLRSLAVPSMNLASDWMGKHIVRTNETAPASRPYPETAQVLKEIIGIARGHGVALLFIRQESGPNFASPDVMPELKRACASYERAFVVDLSHYYNSAQFPDQVHPLLPFTDPYAARHYQVIMRALESLQHPSGGTAHGF